MDFIKSIFQPGNPGPLGGLRREPRRWDSEAHITATPDLRVRLWQVFWWGRKTGRPARPYFLPKMALLATPKSPRSLRLRPLQRAPLSRRVPNRWRVTAIRLYAEIFMDFIKNIKFYKIWESRFSSKFYKIHRKKVFLESDNDDITIPYSCRSRIRQCDSGPPTPTKKFIKS